MTQTKELSTPLGLLRLTAEPHGLCGAELMRDNRLPQQGQTSALLEQAAAELADYFAGTRREFTVPLCLRGTPFQRRVWEALRAIPYGETRTYAEIAAAVGSPRASRAVGMACHRNPVLLFVPCHRVVAAGGRLGGFACGSETKQFLLSLEGNPPLPHTF